MRLQWFGWIARPPVVYAWLCRITLAVQTRSFSGKTTHVLNAPGLVTTYLAIYGFVPATLKNAWLRKRRRDYSAQKELAPRCARVCVSRLTAWDECTKRPVSFFKGTGHNTGDNLLSHPSVGALPLAVTGLTSVFEKGTCVSLYLWSPEWCS